MKMSAKTTFGEVSLCNVVPPIWKSEGGAQSEDEDQTWTQEMEIFEQLGLDEPKEWMTEEDILEAKKLV